MDVSIIIINYNTSLLTLSCIRSIKEKTNGVDYEIIVVDNDSPSDPNLQELKSCSGITYVQSPSNLVFGRANNIGLEYATGKYIFFLNSDTLLVNNAIKMLYDYSLSYSGKLGALGTVLEDTSGKPIHSYGFFPKISDVFGKYIWMPILKAFNQYKINIAYPETSKLVDYVTGADIMVQRTVLEECGAFDPMFFMYYEEVEMQNRFHRAGYENVLVKGPRIIHLEGESSKKTDKSKFIRDTIRQQKSEYIYFYLTESRLVYWAYRIIHPIVRQILWLYPHVSFKDKCTYMKQLFVRIS